MDKRLKHQRHSRESGNPSARPREIPSFAGMTSWVDAHLGEAP